MKVSLYINNVLTPLVPPPPNSVIIKMLQGTLGNTISYNSLAYGGILEYKRWLMQLVADQPPKVDLVNNENAAMVVAVVDKLNKDINGKEIKLVIES